MMVLPALDFGDAASFDYGDLYISQASCVKLADVAIVAVMDDSNGAFSIFHERFARISGPLSGPQIREVMVECGFLNIHIKARPTFATQLDFASETARIVGFRPPSLDLEPLDYRLRGEMLRYAWGDTVARIRVPGATQDQIEKAINAGHFTLLFDDNKRFVSQSRTPGDR
jgi:hypothetical protein